MTRALTSLILLGLLAGCGSATRLRPAEGMTAVPTANAASRSETAAELMTPSTQSQPDRQADLLSKSIERKDDPFALPPGKTNGKRGLIVRDATSPVPAPENVAQDKNVTGQALPKSIDATDDRPDDPEAPVPPAPPSPAPTPAPAQTTP